MKLKDRVAIITGGARGIGRATSIMLSKEGAKIVIIDIKEKEGLETKNNIEKSGGDAFFCKADITIEEEVKLAVYEAMKKYKRLDILVNNAGWGKGKSFHDMDTELRDKILDINLTGVFNVTHAVLPYLIKQNSGKIINIGSGAGTIGAGNESIYSAAKAGVFGFTKALAREVGKNNINVNAIAPGLIDTELLQENYEGSKKLFDYIKRNTPLKRIGKPEDIAAGILYLASEDSSFMTGQVISINGGLTMT
ncbi:MAG: glucose 1-dehydrogenase [Desulfobacterales bacterium]|mgnify:CR=1 FL=1|nr:glucose 1-dehydrogenase [Desulfobacteraceae bacterium]MBT4364719.1 glucose 1-dehydrogenase [Desulfobacteraceae bacterium]MBT7697348.1 glucose 1-dehydrogenase [Desulfobacterales bacterium]